MRLAGKVALVTGAASGIGRAIAERFAQEGARVAMVDVNAEGLGQTAQAIATAGGSEAWAIPADVSIPEEVDRAVAEAVARGGKLDILVNAHGISDLRDTRLLEVPLEVFDRTLAVNLRAIFLLCRAALPHLRATGNGAIVNISSGAALGGGGGTAYTTSKGGVNALTRAIAYQNAASGVRCNVICPGPIDTPMMRASFKKLGLEGLPPQPGVIPRVGRPEEVAALVTFLASDEAAFITGATYTIDGGASQH